MSNKTISWDKLKLYNRKKGGKFFTENMMEKRRRRTHGTPTKKDDWFFFCASENVSLTSVQDDKRIFGVYRLTEEGKVESPHTLHDPYEWDSKQLRFENRKDALQCLNMIVNGDMDYKDYHWY